MSGEVWGGLGVARAAREENFEACRCQRAGKCPMPRIARTERLEIDVDREEEAEQASLEAGEVSPAPTESLRNGNAGVEPAGSGPAAAEEAAADRTQQARGEQQPPRSQHVDDDDSEEGEELGPHTERASRSSHVSRGQRDSHQGCSASHKEDYAHQTRDKKHL